MSKHLTCATCGAHFFEADSPSIQFSTSSRCPACRRTSRRRILRVGAACLGILTLAWCASIYQPWDADVRFLRQPSPAIQAELLTDTPLGSSLKDVQATAARRGWKARGEPQAPYQPPPLSIATPGGPVTVDSPFAKPRDTWIFSVLLGEYAAGWPLPFRGLVLATWTFDAHQKLIDVVVRKEFEGP
jgi:hypothetical protein